jgi:hypothetical protein
VWFEEWRAAAIRHLRRYVIEDEWRSN